MNLQTEIKEIIYGLGLIAALSVPVYFVQDSIRDENSTECCEEKDCGFYEPVCVTYTAKIDGTDGPRCESQDHYMIESIDDRLQCCYCTTKDDVADGFVTQFP